jgi:hypothetical protein
MGAWGVFCCTRTERIVTMNENALFINQTTYDRRALAAMNRLAQASVRKEKSRRTRGGNAIIGVAFLSGGIYCYKGEGWQLAGSLLILYGLFLLLMVLRWDAYQLRSSQRQLQSAMKVCTYAFEEEEFTCATQAGVTHHPYEQVFAVVADEQWYVLFFDEDHGVILEKTGFTEGDALGFKSFIGQHTQLPIQEF